MIAKDVSFAIFCCWLLYWLLELGLFLQVSRVESVGSRRQACSLYREGDNLLQAVKKVHPNPRKRVWLWYSAYNNISMYLFKLGCVRLLKNKNEYKEKRRIKFPFSDKISQKSPQCLNTREIDESLDIPCQVIDFACLCTIKSSSKFRHFGFGNQLILAVSAQVGSQIWQN